MTDLSILGSKGGSKPHTPVESPDSLINISYANILDGLSEGPIVGLVNGAQSIYLDRTPLANSDGSLNFTGVTWEQRTGEHDQDHIAGFPAVESQTSVGVELKASQSWVQSFSNLQLSAVRIQLAAGALVKTNSDGDRVGYRVNYEIDLSTDDGDYVVVNKGALDGKTTTGYQRSIRIDLPAAETGWRIRVRRTTPDSETSNIQAQTTIGTYTEIIDAKLQYPYTALCGLKIDASQFSAVPERAYRIRGRIIQVPTNYDPATRTYTGTWDGTFKLAWTDCPPWIWRDIVLNDRYGLGRFIDQSQVDKWGLYQIAQYCDQMVSDGKGGQEPRFTCSVYLQSRNDALTVLQDLASVFRGMSYYAGSEVACSADMPSDPVYTYTNANVIDGKFNRPGSSGSTRFSVSKVAWTDRENFGNQRVEYVQDRVSLGRYGVRETEVTAFGCVSQGQAQRAGKYILLTNRLETGTINFSVGLDGTICRPGDIIRVADEHFAGVPLSGRVKAATSTTVTMDNDVTGAAGDTLVVILPKGVAETRVIRSVVGRVITVTQAFSATPVKESIYTIETAELVAETYRVLTVNENFGDDKLQYDIVAVQYNASKFEAIDNGAQIVTPPTSILPGAVQAPPTNVELSTFDTVRQGVNVATMRVTWDAPRGAQRYNVWWKRGDGDWIYAGVTYTASIEVKGIYTGVHTARVSAVGAADSSSLWAYSEPTQLYGKTGEPPALASFSAATELFGIRLNWSFPEGAADTFYTEIQESLVASGDDPVQLSMVAYPTRTYLKSGMAAGVTGFFRARLADRTGNTGPWTGWVFGQSGADAGPILELISGQITESELGQNLLSEIEKISGEGPESVNGRIEAAKQELEDLITDLTDPLEYVATNAYAKDDAVRSGQRLYMAIAPVPAAANGSNAPPNPAYWVDIGSIASAANGLAQAVAKNTTDIATVDGKVTVSAAMLQAVQSAYRDDNGEGALNDALRGWDTLAKVSEETRTRATQNEAMATRLVVVESRVDDNIASVRSLERTVATNENATASRLTEVNTKVAGNTASISQLETTVTNNESSTASRLQSVNARVDAANQALDQEKLDRDGAVTGERQAREAAVENEATVRADADEALGLLVETVSAQVDENTGKIQTVEQAQADTNQAVASMRTNIEAVYTAGRDDNAEGELAGSLKAWESTAKIAEESKTRATAIDAQAKKTETLEVSFNSALDKANGEIQKTSASVQVTSQALAALDDKASTMWSVKMQVNAQGHYVAAGIGLGIENGPAGLQSKFLVSADLFAVVNGINGTLSSPFAVQGGQVFMNEAFIQDGTITNAKIGSYISSTNYVAGQQGWILNKSGTFEINGTVAGQGRLLINNQRLRIYHANGNLAIDLGVSV
ncbi:phage tail tip fiber protein [Pseudomonas hunanensis]|uniref:phage tail protein n=1 Tax=Pseudomonas hunanensis TaxID=1247546 RepID=UPI003D00661B